MKSIVLALTAFGALCLPQIASAQVGVSVSIGQPGFYGRLDIGNYPQPQLIFEAPVIIRRAQTVRSPIYLRVPPGHAKNWGKHCGAYSACSRPVYFVDDSWYENTYVPAYKSKHGKGRGEGGGGDRGGNGKSGKGGNKHGKGHGKD